MTVHSYIDAAIASSAEPIAMTVGCSAMGSAMISAMGSTMISAMGFAMTSRSIHPNTNPAPLTTAKSLYGRPSLKDMRNEKAENRARVYEFLHGIGIVPDEVDGLELPVTVDVMSECVEFLRSLGLTIADINNYPLVLGCSVKKNIIPVLDYLGKLGARKSTFTEFLRQYLQVLHASVVVDLGFKLEGTM
ncbi:hypothetical protein ZOSMA_357G00030 [Zostera marina]|uniref:Uncharacterized protein n=1 Tax=Zostera marina TaxID=29655 RepID=A0A0K9P6K2_ZOSMR|nr:hypothetical protein ZOSMA_357G00030 [Zostera marina]